jgi:hypothetical protein
MITVALFIIFVVLLSYFSPKKEIPKLAVIEVSFLKNNHFKIAGDTTNYENFASVLLEKLRGYKDKNIELRLLLPKDKKMQEIDEIFQIANAIENVKLRLITE